MKYFMQHGYHIPMPAFQKFMMFMESCKGFEEDAKRFVFLTSETEDLDFSYTLVRPLFLRLMKQKTGSDILQTFEQFRKNIHLNKKEMQGLEESKLDKAQVIAGKRKDFYRGLMNDLVDNKAFELAQIIQNEMVRDKIEFTIADELVTL